MARRASGFAAAAKRRKSRPLSRALRLARSPRYPRAAELAYRLAVRQVAAAFAQKVRSATSGKLDQYAFRGDASALDDLQGATAINIGGLNRSLLGVAKKLQRHNIAEFKRTGINLREVPDLGKAIDIWRKANVAKIKDLLAGEAKTLVRLLRESEGRTVEQLADRIEERLDVTRSKAEFIARDQTGTLNGQITRDLHIASGITEFIWTTAGVHEERVRESHRELDGERFSYDDPPEVDGYVSIPGEPPNCRCVAVPVIPELDE